jgi:hypothetical protein
LHSLSPGDFFSFSHTWLPDADAALMDPDDLAHPIGQFAKVAMAQETANESSCFIGCDVKID